MECLKVKVIGQHGKSATLACWRAQLYKPAPLDNDFLFFHNQSPIMFEINSICI